MFLQQGLYHYYHLPFLFIYILLCAFTISIAMQGIRLILMVVLHIYAMLSYDYIVFMSIVTSLMKSKSKQIRLTFNI